MTVDNTQTILIVDDEEMNRKLLVALLEGSGYHTATAANGREAIAQARELSPELIFLDIMMPEMDGYEACRILKTEPELKNIPIVMVTALADKESRLRGLKCGADDFLAKPVDPTEVIVKAANLLKIKTYEDVLKRQNEALEETVRNRTADLSQAVSDLKAEMEERQSIEEANRKLSEFARTVIDSLHDPLSIINVDDHRVLSVNKAFLEEYGYASTSEVIGKTCHELTHKCKEVCAPPHDECPLKETVKTNRHVRVDHIHFDAGGNRKYVEIETTPISGAAGTVTEVIHVARDITKRKTDESELLHKHEKLQALFNQVALIKKEWELSMDCTSDMILLIDESGRIKRCNRTMKDFAGMEYRDILGRDWSGLLNDKGLINSGLPVEATGKNTELYHEPSNQWFVLNSYSYENQQMGITGQALTLHDITQRKNMTEALEITNREIENNRSKLENALAEVDNLIQQVTFKRDFSVRFTNPNLRNCREVMHCTKTECPSYANDAERCWQVAGRFSEGKAQGAFTDKFENCSDCPTYKLATSDPIYQIGESFNNMMHILAVQHGELEQAYNDLKVAQSQITQQEKMASIGQLAAGVAHEINNPTGFIMSNLGSFQKYVDRLTEFIRIQSEAVQELATPHNSPLARGEVKGGREPATIISDLESRRKALKVDFITDDLRSLVKESLDGADRIKKIVQDLKSFSRVDETEQKPADINAGIESTINIVWNELKYKATLKKEYGDLPQTKCNPGQLNQVFMNMLVNAAHAIEKQGEIGIRTWAENNAIKVSITDTGSGIPKDKINRIFEPFFTTKEVGKGTGLGLSIAYDIIKKHNGEISVESEVGKGTTFTVTIPIVGS